MLQIGLVIETLQSFKQGVKGHDESYTDSSNLLLEVGQITSISTALTKVSHIAVCNFKTGRERQSSCATRDKRKEIFGEQH